jgi:hypothetical protein
MPAEGAWPEELAALDGLVLVGEPAQTGAIRATYGADLQIGAPVFELAALDQAALEPIAAAIAELAHARESVELGFEREGANRALLHVLTTGGERGRFAVASEPWAWYAGWRIEGLDSAPTLRVADHVASAFLLPPGLVRSPLTARFDPPSTRKGLLCAAFGLVLASYLCLPRRSDRRPATEPADAA